jgi:hypothetical protein
VQMYLGACHKNKYRDLPIPSEPAFPNLCFQSDLVGFISGFYMGSDQPLLGFDPIFQSSPLSPSESHGP